MYILVFPDNDEDCEFLYKGIKESSKDMQFYCSLFSDLTEDGFHRIIIGVDETK